MQPPHPKYKIKEGDTLAGITERFGVEENAWIRYHNKMCPVSEMILKDIFPNVEEIYLLPELWEKADVLYPIETPKPSSIVSQIHNFLFHAPVNFCNRYGVILHLQKDKIHYEIDCVFKGMVSDGIYQIAINRRQVYINNQAPDLKLYEIADLMAKAVYPLSLNINRKWAIEAIANYKEIVQRCKETQKKLSQYFVGEYAEKYIRLFEKQYSNPNNLINHIENELFYRLFFLPIQGAYKNLQKEIQYKFASGKNTDITYNLNITLEPEYTESGKLIAGIKSKEERNNQPCFEAEYRLYPEDNLIFSIRGKHTWVNDKQIACRTDFEIYHLNQDERVHSNNEALNFDFKGKKIAASPKKKHNLWNIFR